ncbi:MAG: FIST C-terminal domain-containing protein [Rhodospirillales bacterium]|nr:MAG: FIST C-terminal domain-containing protein [Rhodospirillales bacterium]
MTGTAPFRAAAAVAPRWQDAVHEILADLGELGREYRLGFVFVTETFAGALTEIEALLRQRTGVPHWVGGAGMGVCGLRAEYFDEPAISVLVMPIGSDAFRLFGGIETGVRDVVEMNADWLAANDPPLAVVHADPANPHIQDLVSAYAEATNAYLVGGMTSTRDDAVQLAGSGYARGLSGVMFSPYALPVAVGLTQGCSPIGPAHTVTRADGNVLIELDDAPALNVFEGDIGKDLAADLRRVGGHVFAALPVTGSDTGDYLVRNLMGVDREHRLLAIGDVVSAGDKVMFCRRDRTTAIEDLHRMLGRLRQRAAGGIRGALYYTCVARGPNQFGPGSREMKIIADELGDIPIAGLFANGEINHDRLYGYTGVLTLFLRPGFD